MGIYIYSQIAPERIDEKAWARVYDDSLKIVRYAQLAEAECKNIEGYDVLTLVPADDKNGRWHAIGDMVTGSCIEDYDMEKDLSRYGKCTPDSGENSLALEYLYSLDRNDESDIESRFWGVFGSKTQGERPHIYLLAIACMIASELPKAAVVYGDITHASCIKACSIAGEVLGRSIALPLQYDYKRLYTSLKEDGKEGQELLTYFITIYDGIKDEEYKSFLKQSFSETELEEYFVQNKAENEIYYSAKEWLEYGLSLDGLCRLCKRLGVEKAGADKLTEALILGKVHIKDKDTYDVTHTDPGNETPDDVEMQFTRIFAKIGGMSRRVIDRYIPIDEIRQTLKKHFDKDAVDNIIDKALDGEGESFERDREVEKLYDNVSELAKERDNSPQYDISEYDELYYWENENTSIEPSLYNAIVDMVGQMLVFGREAIAGELHTKQKRQEYIAARLSRSFLLPEKTVSELLSKADDDGFILKFISVLKVDMRDRRVADLCRALMLNTSLLSFLVKEAEKKKEE